LINFVDRSQRANHYARPPAYWWWRLKRSTFLKEKVHPRENPGYAYVTAVDDKMKYEHVTRLCWLLLALRIHCSDQCKQMLDKLGGYILEPRGTVTIKVCAGPFAVLPDLRHLFIHYPSFCFTMYFWWSILIACAVAWPAIQCYSFFMYFLFLYSVIFLFSVMLHYSYTQRFFT